MADMKFSLSESGYNIIETDRYILRLQEEYRNAVEWGESAERKAEELQKRNTELSTEISESTRLLNEKIEGLTEKNRELEEALHRKKEDDIGKTNDIIRSAQQKAEEIILSANKAVKELVDESVQKLYTAKEETERLNAEKENAQRELDFLKSECEKLREKLRDSMAILGNQFSQNELNSGYSGSTETENF